MKKLSKILVAVAMLVVLSVNVFVLVTSSDVEASSIKILDGDYIIASISYDPNCNCYRIKFECDCPMSAGACKCAAIIITW